MTDLPKLQRVAAYAVIMRDGELLLSRLAPYIARDELWTLPGGGVDHGENPRDAVLREVREETGLDAAIGDTARVYSAHLPGVWRDGSRVDSHALRIVYDGWVPKDAPPPRVQEVDGSTVDSAWHPVSEIEAGRLPVVPMVKEALADHRPFQLQRLAAYALVRDGDRILLTHLSRRGFGSGSWTLPGGGVDFGESPANALAREVHEETGLACRVGEILGVHDAHFSGTAPSGRFEDFHGVHLVFEATVGAGTPAVVEQDGTTDDAQWIPIADVESGRVPVLDVVRFALERSSQPADRRG